MSQKERASGLQEQCTTQVEEEHAKLERCYQKLLVHRKQAQPRDLRAQSVLEHFPFQSQQSDSCQRRTFGRQKTALRMQLLAQRKSGLGTVCHQANLKSRSAMVRVGLFELSSLLAFWRCQKCKQLGPRLSRKQIRLRDTRDHVQQGVSKTSRRLPRSFCSAQKLSSQAMQSKVPGEVEHTSREIRVHTRHEFVRRSTPALEQPFCDDCCCTPSSHRVPTWRQHGHV